MNITKLDPVILVMGMHSGRFDPVEVWPELKKRGLLVCECGEEATSVKAQFQIPKQGQVVVEGWHLVARCAEHDPL